MLAVAVLAVGLWPAPLTEVMQATVAASRPADRHEQAATMNNEIVMTWASLQPALPEIYLTAAICVLLLADVFFGDKRPGFTPTLHADPAGRSAPC